MAMVLKFMSDEDAPDADPRKGFRLVSDVVEARFERVAGAPRAILTDREGETYDVRPVGNVYVLSEAGVQLAAFGVAEIPPTTG